MIKRFSLLVWVELDLFCVEALARTGVGHLILIDKDCVEPSNINRQLVATLDTVDQIKVNVLKERIRTLNPNCIVDTFAFFYDQTKDDAIFFTTY